MSTPAPVAKALAETEPNATFAAVDLGSNSFHLVVARQDHGELRFIDRIREMVRLAGGLDQEGNLELDIEKRALDCLARFGQRLRGIPDANIRAVGTQTLRRMKHANAFLTAAETALGCPVDIISGREEARLIYLGVSQGVAGYQDRRLVIDIGGGSTELIIGEGHDAREVESLQFGCVSATRWYFRDGLLTREAFDLAQQSVMAELQELQARYRRLGWQSAIGSSGTIRATASICSRLGYSGERISREALVRLKEDLLNFSRLDAVNLPGLSARRHGVFAGGLAILMACFDILGIDELRVSPYALREGLLHDLLGRLAHRDPRDTTVQAFKTRYGVSNTQVERVRAVALATFDAITGDDLPSEIFRHFLGWAADLHEVGLGVSHSRYQTHSGYLVEESDMAGFSRQEQAFLSQLVRHHRRELPRRYTGDLPARLQEPLRLLLFCLRLACVLCRTRDDDAIPEFHLSRAGHSLTLHLDPQWTMTHPLTLADLDQEREQLQVLGLCLDIRVESDDG